MAFWSSQTLKKRLGTLISTPADTKISCNAIELRVGTEVYVTPNLDEVFTTTKRSLTENESFQIPPGQFAFLLTEEVVTVPASAMAFISIKATFKMKGLVNVSGFHVDPGWSGPLIFAVFNAGPAPVHLQRRLPLFLLWYADLDEESVERKTVPGSATISPAIINNLTGGADSLYALDTRMKEAIEKLENEDTSLSDRIHALDRAQTKNSVTFGIAITIAVGLFLFAFREAILSLVPHPSATQSIALPAPASPTPQPAPPSPAPTKSP